MSRETAARRGVVAGALASLAVGSVCLACVLPGIGAAVGLSLLVGAVGSVAEDRVLAVVGIAMLATSLALGAYVICVRRRSVQACAGEGPALPPESRP